MIFFLFCCAVVAEKADDEKKTKPMAARLTPQFEMPFQGKNGVMYLESWHRVPTERKKEPLAHVIQSVPCVHCGERVRHKLHMPGSALQINGLAKDAAGQLFSVCGFVTKSPTVHLVVGLQHPKSPFAKDQLKHESLGDLVPVVEDEHAAMVEAISVLGKRGRCWVVPRHEFDYQGVKYPAGQVTFYGEDVAPAAVASPQPEPAPKAAAAPVAKKQKTAKASKFALPNPGQRSLKSFFTAQ